MTSPDSNTALPGRSVSRQTTTRVSGRHSIWRFGQVVGVVGDQRRLVQIPREELAQRYAVIGMCGLAPRSG